MLGTKRLSEAQLVELLRRVQRVDFGDWSQAALTRALQAMGWEVQQGEVNIGMWRAETGYETGPAIADRIPDQIGLTAPADFYAVEVMVLRSAERGRAGENHRTIVFREALRTMLAEFGPPHVRGGDGGPWVRWRDPAVTVELHLKRFHGGVSLRLLATDVWEQMEERDIKRGDISGWTAYAKEAEHPSEPAVTDIGEFTDRLSALMGDMAADVPVVDTAANLVLRTNDWSARYVSVAIDGSVRVEASAAVSGVHRAGLSRLPTLGFRAPSGQVPNWSRHFDVADRPSVSTAAHMMVDALAAFGITDLFDIVYDGFTADGEHMYLPVLGIAGAQNSL